MVSHANVVVIGSYNYCPTVFIERFPRPGESVLAQEIGWNHGGKGANQAIGLSRLGAAVRFICAVGSDAPGMGLRDVLAREGLDDQGIIEIAGPTGVAVIMVDEHGENEIVIAPGANEKLNAIKVRKLYSQWLLDADYVLFQLECSSTLVEELVPWLDGNGVKVVLNPAPVRKLSESVLENLEVLTPNETELRRLGEWYHVAVGSKGKVEDIASALVKRGVRNVVVTLGGRGALWVSPKGVEELAAAKVDVVDTTGAGDAFNAGFVFGLSQGWGFKRATEFGCRAGGFCVKVSGVLDGLGRREEIDALCVEAKRATIAGEGHRLGELSP